ncbi:hypothetical protein VCCP1040_1930, partial [Vibrio cholerae CP1040(13)]
MEPTVAKKGKLVS